MAYRRDRSIRELYEARIMGRSQPAPYQRMVSLVDRRPPFRRSEDDYDRETDFDYGHRGGGFQGDDQRANHGERVSYGGEKRSEPPYRREDSYMYNRGSTEEHSATRQAEFRSSSRGTSQPSSRGRRVPPRPLMSLPVRGDNGVTHGTMNADRRGERESLKRKAPSSPARERSPPKRDVPPSSRTPSSRSYSPECSKSNYPQPSHPKKAPLHQEKERPPSCRTAESRDGSPHSSVLATKEEMAGAEVEQVEEVKDEAGQTPEERRAHVIANKALEIEKLYRQDCETFGMVVRMLVAKEPTLEKQLETALKENLIEIKERCLEDLRHFISEVNVVLKSDQS